MMEFYRSSKHKSRKKRVCEMCGLSINVGDYYYSERGKFEGEFFSVPDRGSVAGYGNKRAGVFAGVTCASRTHRHEYFELFT